MRRSERPRGCDDFSGCASCAAVRDGCPRDAPCAFGNPSRHRSRSRARPRAHRGPSNLRSTDGLGGFEELAEAALRALDAPSVASSASAAHQRAASARRTGRSRWTGLLPPRRAARGRARSVRATPTRRPASRGARPPRNRRPGATKLAAPWLRHARSCCMTCAMLPPRTSRAARDRFCADF